MLLSFLIIVPNELYAKLFTSIVISLMCSIVSFGNSSSDINIIRSNLFIGNFLINWLLVHL